MAVFPKSPTFVEPGKRALHNPTLWQDSKCVELVTLDDLNLRTRKGLDRVCKCFSGVTSICHNLFERREMIGYITIIINHINRAGSICYIGSCHHNCVWQPQSVHTNM